MSNKNTTTFGQIETNQIFRFNCMYWIKTGPNEAYNLSDEPFEKGTEDWFPTAGTVTFAKHKVVDASVSITRIPSTVLPDIQTIIEHNYPEIQIQEFFNQPFQLESEVA